MNFLHSCTPPVIHRDLKTPNILLLSTDESARICAKVCDFGLSLRTHSAAGREVGTQSHCMCFRNGVEVPPYRQPRVACA